MAAKDRRERLERELLELLPSVDGEGMEFLLRQAKTIVHNLEVERVNQEIQRLGDQATQLSRDARSREARSSPGERSAAVGGSVVVEPLTGNKSFVLVAPGERKMLALEELRAMARICHAAKNTKEGAANLHRWLKQNRQDIVNDLALARPSSPLLVSLYEEVRGKYRPRQ